MASLLCICDQGYRASVEEQDDTVIWMAHMLQREDNTTVALLLRGSAVNYASRAQESVGVTFGDWTQEHPADFPRDLARFRDDGGRVLALASDLPRYGLTDADLVDGVTSVGDADVVGLVAEHDIVSFW
ncbi:MAG: hypothetical protein ACERLM_04445 [Acidimicrobiales bacterium]